MASEKDDYQTEILTRKEQTHAVKANGSTETAAQAHMKQLSIRLTDKYQGPS